MSILEFIYLRTCWPRTSTWCLSRHMVVSSRQLHHVFNPFAPRFYVHLSTANFSECFFSCARVYVRAVCFPGIAGASAQLAGWRKGCDAVSSHLASAPRAHERERCWRLAPDRDGAIEAAIYFAFINYGRLSCKPSLAFCLHTFASAIAAVAACERWTCALFTFRCLCARGDSQTTDQPLAGIQSSFPANRRNGQRHTATVLCCNVLSADEIVGRLLP